MKGLFFVLCAGILKGLYTVIFLRSARRRHQANPEAVRHIRLTSEGSGWWYEYGWPRRKRRYKRCPDSSKDIPR